MYNTFDADEKTKFQQNSAKLGYSKWFGICLLAVAITWTAYLQMKMRKEKNQLSQMKRTNDLDHKGRYIIKKFDQSPAFSSFLPGMIILKFALTGR